LNAQDKKDAEAAIDLLKFESSSEENLFASYLKGDTLNLLSLYLVSGSNFDIENQKAIDIREFVRKLKSKQQSKAQDDFLKYLFYKTHRRYLRSYENHSSMEDLFMNGKYDCLSGTSLYVLLLEELGYDYEIKETDYHIYLLVNSKEAGSNHKFLLESTDPAIGFVSNEQEILERLKFYLNSPLEDEIPVQGILTASPEYRFSRRVNNSINEYELAGLHYYNQGIYYYNHHQYLEAFQSLQKALFLYNSSRIKEFLDLTTSVALASDKLNAAEKLILKELHQKWDSATSEKKLAQNN
jgi:hypothetical protein